MNGVYKSVKLLPFPIDAVLFIAEFISLTYIKSKSGSSLNHYA